MSAATSLKRTSIAPVLSAGLLVLVLQPALAQGIPADEVTSSSLKFARVYQTLEENYAAPIDPDHVILDGGIRAMLASLDPFSSFFDKSQFAMLQQETRGEALGFGSILYVQPGKITIIQTQQGSPSWRAGLGPGDEVVAVNGVSTEPLGLRQLIALLQAAKSHPVHLTVIRPGDLKPTDVTMKPAEVNLPTVDTSFVGANGIGYIHIASFESKTPQEVMAALRHIGAEHLKGIILDLRNPGGVLEAAVEVCSIFLKPGAVVLTVEGRAVPQKTYGTVPVPSHVDVPLITLVNGSTASAAEVVAAALQDHDRALVVGEPTFGKGVVENVVPLSNDMGLALLTAEYFTPSGRSVQKPLPGTALQNPALGIRATGLDPRSADTPVFHTDDGRPVRAAGGVSPDVSAPDWKMDPWLTFLNQTGMFTSFASAYVSIHHPIAKTFEPDTATLETFRNFLTSQRIRSPERYWSQDQEYLQGRIRTEIFNLEFGLDYGNQVAAEEDPQVRKAASLFPEISKLLKSSPEERRSYATSRKQ
ncbi:MAG TPA: S41 family peptidase [Terriglobia bacterium]|nr:S41 family peptidase [Terriglobia bacterium]